MESKNSMHFAHQLLSSPKGSLLHQFDQVRVTYHAALQRLVDRVQGSDKPYVEGDAAELDLLIDLMKAEADMVMNRRITLIAGVIHYRKADIARCRSLMEQLSNRFEDYDPAGYYAILEDL